MAAGAAQGGLPLKARPAVASSRLTGITFSDLLIKDQRPSRLSAEPPETSEKPLPPVFYEAEALAIWDTAGEHPSG